MMKRPSPAQRGIQKTFSPRQEGSSWLFCRNPNLVLRVYGPTSALRLPASRTTFDAKEALNLMNKFLKPGLWLFIFVYGLPLSWCACLAQAPVRAEECQSPPPHLHANLWMQTSAEYQALCRQTFSSALREIKQAEKEVRNGRQGRPVGPGQEALGCRCRPRRNHSGQCQISERNGCSRMG